LALSYLKLFREADLLHQGAPSLEALLRALRDTDAIREYFRRAENALNANLDPHLEEGAAITFGRVTGIISARGGWFQADIADVIGWKELLAIELKLERARQVLNVEDEIVQWARGAGVLSSHRLLDLLAKPGHPFPAVGHPKAGRLLELKAGTTLDQAQVWKYLGTFGDLENGALAGELRFVVNIPPVVDPADPSLAMLRNLERIWNGLKAPEFLDGHPRADDLLDRLLASLQINRTPAYVRDTPFAGIDEPTLIGLQRLVIEWPTDIPVSDTFYRPPNMPGLPETVRLAVEGAFEQ
jgi:hypothetical protein